MSQAGALTIVVSHLSLQVCHPSSIVFPTLSHLCPSTSDASPTIIIVGLLRQGSDICKYLQHSQWFLHQVSPFISVLCTRTSTVSDISDRGELECRFFLYSYVGAFYVLEVHSCMKWLWGTWFEPTLYPGRLGTRYAFIGASKAGFYFMLKWHLMSLFARNCSTTPTLLY